MAVATAATQEKVSRLASPLLCYNYKLNQKRVEQPEIGSTERQWKQSLEALWGSEQRTGIEITGCESLWLQR